ncbi:DUF4837 family protein [Rubrivirga sp. S365]|uniref:DUF4837 family protein n=1 Tax=Rubrivirga litoralis TaxID=3075598 RepID=A0ABU3BRJ0_9BACT|nr:MULTISPECIES: DUF4837 family protein [unclassified Rubrivirga]MDT0631909.1 DUF4837 family protein [Rubrivirga sp. F394]MDT7857962.1 DUF4837 family protein [Rubrivirga sp. S365]
MTGLPRPAPLAAALAVVLAVLAGCESFAGQTTARGDVEEITVVSDSATWAGPVGEAIRAELAQPIATLPGNQGAFKLNFQPLTSRFFDQLKLRRALVFAAPIDADGPIGDFIRARVGEGGLDAVRSGGVAAFNLRPDLWANGQLVVIATAADERALAREFLQRGPELRAAFNALARENTTGEMFARLRQEDLEADLLDAHDYRVQIQHDYVQVQDTAATAGGLDGSFVRYRRVLSDTWRDFFVFAADGVETLPPPAEIDRITNDLLETFARGTLDSSYVQLDDQRPMTRDTAEIAGRPAQETRGFWYMTNDIMGGSFVRYAFVDPATDRLYVFYGMTFAPDRRLDKRSFLRQMEAVAYTFRTRADLEAEARAEGGAAEGGAES